MIAASRGRASSAPAGCARAAAAARRVQPRAEGRVRSRGGRDDDLADRRVRLGELQQEIPLRSSARRSRFEELAERRERQRRRLLPALDPEGPGDEAVERERSPGSAGSSSPAAGGARRRRCGCGRRDPARGCRTRAGSAPAPGVSSSGRGASGRSKSSRPRSSRKVASSPRSASKVARRPPMPDQFWASVTLAGPNAAR